MSRASEHEVLLPSLVTDDWKIKWKNSILNLEKLFERENFAFIYFEKVDKGKNYFQMEKRSKSGEKR